MGTWTHPALARKRRTAFRNDAVEQIQQLTSGLLLAPTYLMVLPICELISPASRVSLMFRAAALWREDESPASGKCGKKRVHSVNQILPGDLDRFLNSGDVAIVGILEFVDAMLEFREASANVFEFPIALKFDVYPLLSKTVLQKSHARGKVFHFPNSPFEIRFL